MKLIRTGCYRQVLLVGQYAIKFPYVFYKEGSGWGKWWKLLSGLQHNIQEACCYKFYGNSNKLCPVIFSFVGFILVMRKAIPLPREEFINFNYKKFINVDIDNENINLNWIENKENSFGIIDGKIVAIDYA